MREVRKARARRAVVVRALRRDGGKSLRSTRGAWRVASDTAALLEVRPSGPHRAALRAPRRRRKPLPMNVPRSLIVGLAFAPSGATTPLGGRAIFRATVPWTKATLHVIWIETSDGAEWGVSVHAPSLSDRRNGVRTLGVTTMWKPSGRALLWDLGGLALAARAGDEVRIDCRLLKAAEGASAQLCAGMIGRIDGDVSRPGKRA